MRSIQVFPKRSNFRVSVFKTIVVVSNQVQNLNLSEKSNLIFINESYLQKLMLILHVNNMININMFATKF